jgi:putative restriction endonuclease
MQRRTPLVYLHGIVRGLYEPAWPAFDSSIIGITPDLEVKVRLAVLQEIDRPLLQHGLQGFQNRRIHVPRADHHKPNRDFLAERYELFRNTS